MQRYLPAGAVRVVSASTSAPPTEYVIEEELASVDELPDDGGEEVLRESDMESDDSSPVSVRVARFLDSGKVNGPKKRKRAKLNHLTGEQKVERRKILNRIAAQMARDRKKVQMDELEKIVKELASENMRLARENADLRQKSTDLEVENVKLRGHLGRNNNGSASQTASTSAGATRVCAIASVKQPGRQEFVTVKPVGVAARVEGESRAAVNVSGNSDWQPEAKRTRVINESRAQNGASDAAQRNAAAVCVSTQQQYSFARRARALFSVLCALLLVGLRASSTPEADGQRRRAESRRASKLERLGALVARRIARSAPLREAYWKLRQSGTLTPQTVALMRQRLSMSARLAALRRTSHALHLRVATSTRMSRSQSPFLSDDFRTQ